MPSTASPNFRKIGLTGGVASGKTTVAGFLKEYGYTVINLDEIGREITKKDPVAISQIASALGSEVMVNGQFNRTKARELLFSNDDKRKKVESILHPKILEEFERRAEQAKNEGKKTVICEAALLMEAGIDKSLDGVILVSATENLRTDRAVERDKIGAMLVQKMIRSQMKDIHRQSHNNFFAINNSGSLADLRLKVDEMLEDWKTRGWIDA